MTVKNVLAAVDQFPQDEAVLARALEIAAAHDAELTVVHVIDLPGYGPDPDEQDTLQGQAALAARDRIEAALAGQDGKPAETKIRIETGSPALRLIEICEDLRPNLMVMRAHQRTRISETILGSTTDRLIAWGQVPVLVVKRAVNQPYTRVLLATDGKDDASDALAFVAALLPDTALHLVQAVMIPPQLEEAMLRVGTDQAGLIAYRNRLTGNAKEHLGRLAATVPPRATKRVLQGEPATTLVRATRGPKVDLIALGPGRTNLIRRAFIGSVTRRMLRDAECDVLICHASEPRSDG